MMTSTRSIESVCIYEEFHYSVLKGMAKTYSLFRPNLLLISTLLVQMSKINAQLMQMRLWLTLKTPLDAYIHQLLFEISTKFIYLYYKYIIDSANQIL